MATSHLSLIIPVYNRPNEVEELLDSLTRQSETNFEVVIVEDGSKETCQHVVEAFKDKLDVSYSYIPNGGPGNARNYGAKQSKGDYLIVLDSDCILPPDYIKSVNKELKETGADAFGGPDKASDSFTDVQKAINYSMTSFFTTGGIRGGNSVNYETATYEGYGPSGTAIIVKCLTDNKNRTAANVRNAFTKGQGSIGTQGCVSYMFDEKGQIIIDKEECDMDADDLMMQALDAGAEDFADEDDSYEITTAPADFDAVRTALEEAGITMASAEVTMIPQTYVTLTDEADITNIGRILDLLDDDDDVQEVYHNWEE